MRLCPGESVERNVINASKKEEKILGTFCGRGIKAGKDCQTIKVKWIPWDGGGKGERGREKRKNRRSGLDEERKQLPSGSRNDELSFSFISAVKAIKDLDVFPLWEFRSNRVKSHRSTFHCLRSPGNTTHDETFSAGRMSTKTWNKLFKDGPFLKRLMVAPVVMVRSTSVDVVVAVVRSGSVDAVGGCGVFRIH